LQTSHISLNKYYSLINSFLINRIITYYRLIINSICSFYSIDLGLYLEYMVTCIEKIFKTDTDVRPHRK